MAYEKEKQLRGMDRRVSKYEHLYLDNFNLSSDFMEEETEEEYNIYNNLKEKEVIDKNNIDNY